MQSNNDMVEYTLSALIQGVSQGNCINHLRMVSKSFVFKTNNGNSLICGICYSVINCDISDIIWRESQLNYTWLRMGTVESTNST